MLQHMLVPLDGSAEAEASLPAVQALGQLTGARVTLLQAIEPLTAVLGRDGARAAGDAAARQAAERAAPRYLAAVAGRLDRAGLAAQTRVVFGPAAATILQAAREVDLIALATRGPGRGRRAYGPVVAAVLRDAPGPVVLVRAGAGTTGSPSPPRRLLVPLDGSEAAERALPMAIDLARRAGAEVLLAHSLQWAQRTVVEPCHDVAGLGVARLPELAYASAGAYLRAIGQRLVEQGLAVHRQLSFREDAEAIVTGAEEQSVDLIVMTNQGRHGVGQWGAGAVADRVLRAATAPILLVPAGAPAPVARPAPAAHGVAAPAPATG
jgi:nucleotide-binding universal stress UspA family protein